MNTIEVRNLVKYYNRGKVKAVDDISFDVPEGSRFGFLGPNGAGKTTTIRCLLGLLQKTAGEVTIFGKPVNPTKEVYFRNRVGYLPGELGLYKQMTGFQLVEYFSKLYDVDIDRIFIKDVAERLQIDMERKMGVLSKGNKQKIGVLTALMGKFDLLVMDEPTSGLDPLMQSEFYNIVSERQKESNCTVFVSSHVLPEVEKFCDKVAIIKNGKIIEISDIQNLKAKSLKNIELDFFTGKSKESFVLYLKTTFPNVIIQTQYETQVSFLLSPAETLKILREISDREWEGAPIRDVLIKHSSLENIFMEYYKDENNNQKIMGGGTL
ncbi:MAG: ABC transporter ATP-binding protein [Candidatus Lokiarchaeota archaeon]|nr:ABC transporter ATP-binding protein [Candidatus Lokiarchaeota archaeon]